MIEIKNNCAVDVLTGNINDAKGSTGQFGEFTFGVLLDEDKVIHMVDMRDASLVFMSIVFVSQSLVALMKRLPMSEVGSWHDHVMVKGELGRGGLEGGMKGGIKSPLDGSQEVLLDIGESLKRDRHEGQGAKLVGDDLVGPFEDAVHLWIGGTCNVKGDSI